ncbi:hypothetical protein [Aeromonas diversa]|uniref:Lipoprotein n=1 Tax=Aeromonas diversa CDC 2478-85 TaxID=1268237 RepID=N9VDT6_9GAMM|nr:hypothetical protein [Aeromonas diversa]ENY73422.1 hypothetical protein G114_02694 [Aeromonas diversa CDC 2478-85]
MRMTLALGLVLLLAGCSKLDKAHYDRLKLGMSYEEVSAVLGKAERCDEALGASDCVWGDEQRQVRVGFIAGKAALFSSKGLN